MRDPDSRPSIGRLTRRADFLRVGKGRRRHVAAFTLQAAPRADAPDAPPRLGFTLTRKVGNAVVRNRARRRLKEAVRLSPDLPLVAGHDYVIVGRIEAVTQPFARLAHDLSKAVDDIHAHLGDAPRAKKRPERTGPQA